MQNRHAAWQPPCVDGPRGPADFNGFNKQTQLVLCRHFEVPAGSTCSSIVACYKLTDLLYPGMLLDICEHPLLSGCPLGCVGEMYRALAGQVLDFFGVSRGGGDIAFFHPASGKRWQLASMKGSGSTTLEIRVSQVMERCFQLLSA